MRTAHLRRQALDRARRFLAKRAGFLSHRLVSGDLDGIRRVVVIPVLAEEERLFETLDSLDRNGAEELAETLVICVVNNRAEPHARPEQAADNQRTLAHLENLVHGRPAATQPRINPVSLRLAYVDASSPGHEIGPKMGVGEGRRIGLDLGLSVLTENAEHPGLLISLDADTLVEADYLCEVQKHFDSLGPNQALTGGDMRHLLRSEPSRKYSTDLRVRLRFSEVSEHQDLSASHPPLALGLGRDSRAAVVGYAHTLPTQARQRAAIVRYELFLRYHELGLRSARSPYAYPTIGSTMVTRSDAYVAAGGMNRRQAGEDFYFLQELAKTGGVSRVDSTTVHPSARSSDRVPFGTGATVGRHLSGADDGSAVYHPESYKILGAWLSMVGNDLDRGASELLNGADGISPHLRKFLELNRFEEIWPRLQQNAAHHEGLASQFHRWFDAFKTLKLIHFLRDHQLSKSPIFDAIREQCGPGCSGIARDNLADDLEAQEDLLKLLRRRCAADEC